MSQQVKVDRGLVFKEGAKTYVRAQNKSGGALVRGNVVIYDTTNSTATNICFTTTTSQDDVLVLGMLDEPIASNGYGLVQIEGPTAYLMVDGTTDIAAGYEISTFTTAGVGAKATAGAGGAFAIALEAYTTNDGNGVIDAIIHRPPRVGSTATVSLDAAYNGGRSITVDAGTITVASNQASADALTITEANAAGTGALIDLTHANTAANDIEGTSDTWTVSAAGVAKFDSLNTVGVIKFAADTLGTGAAMIGSDNTGDVTINALSGKSVHCAVNDVDVLDVAGAAITLKQATTISTGGLTVSDTGITVTTGNALLSSGNLTLTSGNLILTSGNLTMTGDISITGNFSCTGTFTLGNTVTVDELILDTDGAAPAATNCYVVRDNSGDLTLNCYTGKSVNIAVAGNDEFTFSGTVLAVAAANDIQFMDDGGLLDSNGNEVLLVEATGSAVNYLQVTNAVTANPITLKCMGTNDRGFIFANAEAEAMLVLSSATTAIYGITILSAASGGKPTIQSYGAADIGIDFETSESEEMLTLVPVATGVNNIVITNAASGAPKITCSAEDVGIIFGDGSATTEEILILEATATALYEITIKSAATGGKPLIKSTGANDIAIDFGNAENEVILTLTPTATTVYSFNMISAASGGVPTLQTAGAADIGMSFETSESEEMLVLENIATAVDYVNIKSGDGTTMPTISTAGGTAAVDLVLAPKGTGAVVLNNGTDPVVLKLMGAQAGYNNEIQDVNGNEIIALQGVATAVNELKISNSATGNPVIVGVQTSATNESLMFDTAGTGTLTIALGGDEVLRFHDAAAMTFAAAADTAGHAIYIQTEDGGADGGAGTGRAGALLHISTGDGSASATATAVGGAGGALSIVSGAGNTGNTTGNGGAGGAIAITAGAGGDSGAGAGVGGTGGTITLTAGAGGGAGGGTAGAPGRIAIGAGCLAMKVQTIDMASNDVTLTLVPGTPSGTTMTGNILYVDANGEGDEVLLMPPEGDCTGLAVFVVNTGGETITVKNDAAGALVSVATAEVGVVFCDGTTWRGFVGVA